MLDISSKADGSLTISGRLDAASAPEAQQFLDQHHGNCTLDMKELEYISSAGLGVLLKTHKRLTESEGALRLVNVSTHINEVFGYSGFDKLFDITPAE